MWLRMDASLGNLVIQWFTGAKWHPYFKSCMNVLRSEGELKMTVPLACVL